MGVEITQPQSEYRILEVLYSLSFRTHDLKNYLKKVADGVSELLHIDWSIVTFCQAGAEQIFASSLDLGEAEDEIYSLHGTVTGTVVETGSPLMVEDSTLDHEYGEVPEGYRAYLGIPLRTSYGEVIGTICSFHRQIRHFTPEEVQLAVIFAERAATAIDNYLIYQQVQQFNDTLEAEVMQRTLDLRAAQAQLMESHAELERRVEQRTAELQQLNQCLQAEIRERQESERALRQSEELFRQFAENLESVFWMRTPNCQPIYISPAFETIWGYPCQDWYDNPNLGRIAMASGQVDHYLEDQNGCGKTEQEYQIVRADGAIRIIRDQAFPIRDETGRVYRIAGIAEDITERKQAEQSQSKALAALAEVGELASMIVHEIRNPLTTVWMGLNFFKRMDLPATARERLTLSLEEAERLRTLLNEILLYAKSQTFQRTLINLNEFIAELLSALRTMPSATKRQIEFMPIPQSLWVQVDRDKLKQVMINLVDNACEAILENDKVTVRIELENNQVYIRVNNQGEPIPPEILPKLTKPFYTTKSTGTGLGLAIVKRIVEAHGGELTIHSSAETGTTISVGLPLAQPHQLT